MWDLGTSITSHSRSWSFISGIGLQRLDPQLLLWISVTISRSASTYSLHDLLPLRPGFHLLQFDIPFCPGLQRLILRSFVGSHSIYYSFLFGALCMIAPVLLTFCATIEIGSLLDSSVNRKRKVCGTLLHSRRLALLPPPAGSSFISLAGDELMLIRRYLSCSALIFSLQIRCHIPCSLNFSLSIPLPHFACACSLPHSIPYQFNSSSLRL